MIDTTGTHPYFPWEPSTAPATPTYPEQPSWKEWPQPTPSIQQWPMPADIHPAELEKFEEFVIWACGFTDPENPPSQKKWEEFQKKVQELAADFVEFKRQKREAERLHTQPFTVTTSNVGASADVEEMFLDNLTSTET